MIGGGRATHACICQTRNRGPRPQCVPWRLEEDTRFRADRGELLACLLDVGRSTVAGRLAGAFRHNRQPGIAEEIQKTMRSAGYDILEVNPFASTAITGPAPGLLSPIVTRLHGLWELARPIVLSEFPQPPGLPRSKRAYHSLSIEGYSVTPE